MNKRQNCQQFEQKIVGKGKITTDCQKLLNQSVIVHSHRLSGRFSLLVGELSDVPITTNESPPLNNWLVCCISLRKNLNSTQVLDSCRSLLSFITNNFVPPSPCLAAA
ncbi:hypothetical protein [Candidatus Enterococcus ferrettii]|uniref:Uncharacterized protein n=1 Tax=Candidatus Enterococcus ferrettii TaxID=2815324 RepID=A0ABV0EK79_9ENTE|nr:hypothetical protein [Enterococcus sp. 665A]MBO1341379.1 hypothetical protein [Enterococcus sp. 665A]